ncbi:MAG TPA: transporter substrate-binding domain-containing protein [Spirochaetota bacterium]|nr:transporter substrate-binding domain-containing protein [Spirochaetota bacterium]
MRYLYLLLLWILFFLNCQAFANKLDLTEEEKLFIKEHSVITVVSDANWPPVEYADDFGDNIGISADYLRLVEERTGIKFKRIKGISWQNAYKKLQSHAIDMTTCVRPTPLRESFLIFTEPYIEIPTVIVTHFSVAYVSHLGELNGKKIAVVRNYAPAELLKQDFPDINLVYVNSVEEGLNLLDNNQVFALIDNMLVVGYYIAINNMYKLKIAGETPYKYSMSMAVRKDWPQLLTIIQKALDSISPEERKKIYNRWVAVRYEYSFNYVNLIRAALGMSVLILLMLFWIRRLRREIKQRIMAENSLAGMEQRLRIHLLETPLGIIEWDMNFSIIEWNPACERIFGYSKGDVLGKNGDFMVQPADREKLSSIWNKLSRSRDSIYNLNENIKKNGSIIVCDWINTPIIDSSGDTVSIISLCRDITDDVAGRNRIRQSLKEKEILLRELYHRTKNNMQVIIAYLLLQSDKINEPVVHGLVKKTVSYIQSMALVHQKLCQSSSLVLINISEYLNELIKLIQGFYSGETSKITTDVSCQSFNINMDTALALGLVVNELVINSYKHAFGLGEEGSIVISLKKTENNVVVLNISDNGRGLSKEIDLTQMGSVGLLTARSIVESQLNGTLSVRNEGGLSIEIVFSIKNEPPDNY